MAELTVQQIALGGILPTYAAAAGGGDNFVNDGENTFLHIKNGDVSPMTVTLTDVKSVTPLEAVAFDADVAVIVAATSEQMIGPLPVGRFGGDIAITYTSVTTLTVAAVRL